MRPNARHRPPLGTKRSTQHQRLSKAVIIILLCTGKYKMALPSGYSDHSYLAIPGLLHWVQSTISIRRPPYILTNYVYVTMPRFYSGVGLKSVDYKILLQPVNLTISRLNSQRG